MECGLLGFPFAAGQPLDFGGGIKPAGTIVLGTGAVHQPFIFDRLGSGAVQRLIHWLPWLTAAGIGAAGAIWLDAGLWRLLVGVAAVAILHAPKLSRAPTASTAADRARLLLLLAVASTVQATAPALWHFTTSPWVRVWNVYHYYLGSKYFAELGYHDLYVATLTADRADDNYWSRIDKVRDLRTYEVVSRAEAVAGYRPHDHFSDERWQAFRRDVRALQVHRSPEGWQGIFRDRGYNPPPLWTAVGGILTRLPADNLAALKLLCVLDSLLLAATFWLIGRTFGWQAMAAALLLFTLSPVNEGRIVGGFLQYDWFCAIAAGLCFLRQQRPLPAAALLAYAVGTRVFPAFLLLSAAVPLIYRWIRDGKFARRDLRLAAALSVCGLVAFGAATLGGGGLDAWHGFTANIGHHNDAHRFGEKRIGLAHAFTRDIRGLDFEPGGIEERRALFAGQKNLFRASAAVLLGLWIVVVARRRVPDALLLGLVPLFVLAVGSRYYWSCLALLPLLARPGPSGHRRVCWLTAAQAAVMAALGAAALRGFRDFPLYSFFDLLVIGLLLAVLGAYLLHDLRVRRRQRPLRTWYRSKALAAGFFVFLFLVLCWLRMPIADIPIRDVDESVSALIAASWLDGGIPYRDAIDQRGPVTYLIYAAVFAVAGVHNMEAVHWTLLLLILVSCVLVFRLGRTLRDDGAGFAVAYLAAFLLAVATFTYRRSQMLAFHTEWPMMLFDALAMLLLWRGLRRRESADVSGSAWRDFVLAGLCFALGFLSKQPGLFDAGAGALFVLLWQHRRNALFSAETWRIAAALAAGFFATLVATAGYFALHGALGDFVLYYWTYNVEHYTAVVSVADRLASLDPFAHSRHYLTANPLLFAGALWSTVAAIIAWIRRERTDGRLLIVLWMAFGYFGASYSGRNFGHYFIQIIVPACLLTALAADDLRRLLDAIGRRWRTLPDIVTAARVAVVVLAAVALAAPVVRFGDEIAWRNLWREHRGDDRRERLLDAIREHSAADDSIFVWGYYPELYVLAPRRPASRYSNTNYLTGMLPWENHQPGVDTSEHIVGGAWEILIDELEASAPAVVVDTAVGDHRYYSKYPIKDFPALSHFLAESYLPVETVEDRKGEPVATLWVRDESQT